MFWQAQNVNSDGSSKLHVEKYIHDRDDRERIAASDVIT